MMETENHAEHSSTTIATHQKEDTVGILGDVDKMSEDQSSSNPKETSYIQCPSSMPISISSSNASDQEASRDDFCSYSHPAALDLILASDHHQECEKDSTHDGRPGNGMISRFFIHEPLAKDEKEAQSHPKSRSPPKISDGSVKTRTAGFKRPRSSAEATNTPVNNKSSSSRHTIATSSILTTPRSIINYKSIPTSSILPAPWAAASLSLLTASRRRRKHKKSRGHPEPSSLTCTSDQSCQKCAFVHYMRGP